MLFGATAPILLQRPPEDALPLFQYSMRRLFSLFAPERIVQLTTCALLEQQIVLRSRDYELLVLVAECVTALMHPFLWQHVYVPILPSTALHFVEAPVPYIMGLHSDFVVDSPTEVRADGGRAEKHPRRGVTTPWLGRVLRLIVKIAPGVNLILQGVSDLNLILQSASSLCCDSGLILHSASHSLMTSADLFFFSFCHWH